ncbi:hypothetical protein CIHG_04723 [Coccidioides immitis H538.4]|uniref:Uncharacterized protein n=1 Tax=Coccidioides immitis H538.4 TaxID=396776 RepID=A0A0J8UIH4_COCIT|nr:hypothetical protein CIHG_04723 [Coccidioides immitis H538.4]
MDSESNNGGPSAERPVLASRASFSMFKLPDREEYLSNLPKSKRAAPEGFDIASIGFRFPRQLPGEKPVLLEAGGTPLGYCPFNGLGLPQFAPVNCALLRSLLETSTLQDYDIAVEYPELPDDPGLRPWRLLYQYWTEYSKIVGRVYELLFSARALCDSAAERSRKAQKLEEEIKDWRTTMARFEPGDAYHAFFFGWMIPGADLSYYLLLTLSARRALQLHQHVMLTFRAKDTYVMKGYVDWTILQCPFVPFLVIFCHTISSGDLDDLKLLEEVATSLQAAGSLSEGAERLYRLCMVFYQVAKVYVDAKRQEVENTNTTSEYQPIAYPGEQFDSYLNALGLGPSLAPSMLRGHADIGNNDGVEAIPELFDVEMAQSLEDWYLGNRHMMGLLESDF